MNIYIYIYDILQKNLHPKEKTPILNHLKAEIANIHSKRFQSLPSDTLAPTLFQGEQPSIFNLLNMRKRRVSRLITSVIDTKGVKQTSTRSTLHTFVACKVNMTQFRWMIEVLIKLRRLCIGR
jgi:hypothetical protein